MISSVSPSQVTSPQELSRLCTTNFDQKYYAILKCDISRTTQSPIIMNGLPINFQLNPEFTEAQSCRNKINKNVGPQHQKLAGQSKPIICQGQKHDTQPQAQKVDTSTTVQCQWHMVRCQWQRPQLAADKSDMNRSADRLRCRYLTNTKYFIDSWAFYKHFSASKYEVMIARPRNSQSNIITTLYWINCYIGLQRKQ